VVDVRCRGIVRQFIGQSLPRTGPATPQAQSLQEGGDWMSHDRAPLVRIQPQMGYQTCSDKGDFVSLHMSETRESGCRPSLLPHQLDAPVLGAPVISGIGRDR
jgi:hypothetical protein